MDEHLLRITPAAGQKPDVADLTASTQRSCRRALGRWLARRPAGDLRHLYLVVPGETCQAGQVAEPLDPRDHLREAVEH